MHEGILNPIYIWTWFKEYTSDNLGIVINVEELSFPEEIANLQYDFGLNLLEHELQSLGKSLEMYAFIRPVHVWNIRHRNPQIMHLELLN